MNQYVATFHTHVSALMTARALAAKGVEARMAPVPRKLSSSCGTCVFFTADSPLLDAMDGDMERVYEITQAASYEVVSETDE